MNQTVLRHLKKWIDQDTVPHSLLFAGPEDSPKKAAALSFAWQLLKIEEGSESPDLYQYHPEGKLGMHTIESMRGLSEEVYKLPYKASKKVLIIHAAERMQPPCANALLKTFEEPLSSSVILLLSSHPESLLPTVRSRCQTVYFQSEGTLHEELGALLEPILSQLTTLSPIALMEKVDLLVTWMEKNAIEEMVPAKTEETVYQKALAEKENEGKNALNLGAMTQGLWAAILSWYRDLQVISLGLRDHFLLQPHLKPLLQRQSHQSINLDLVEKEIEKAKVAFSRSSPLKHVLESLFFALKA